MRGFGNLLTALLLLWLGAGAAAAAQLPGPLVLAAASLKEALGEIGAAWTARGHAAPVLSFAATSALARQADAGAPADLFIAADAEWMDHLERRGRTVPGTRAVIASGRLALVAPAGSVLALRIAPAMPIRQALGEGRLAMADPASVPAGRYGRAALTSLGVWPAVKDRIAAAENVRAALLLVERGAAPLGIVYATDARASGRVRLIGLFPERAHPPIIYPAARLKASRHPEAEALRGFLLSAEAQAILKRHGFGPPVRG